MIIKMYIKHKTVCYLPYVFCEMVHNCIRFFITDSMVCDYLDQYSITTEYGLFDQKYTLTRIVVFAKQFMKLLLCMTPYVLYPILFARHTQLFKQIKTNIFIC